MTITTFWLCVLMVTFFESVTGTSRPVDYLEGRSVNGETEGSASYGLGGTASQAVGQPGIAYGSSAGSQASGAWIPRSPTPSHSASTTARTPVRSSFSRHTRDQVQ